MRPPPIYSLLSWIESREASMQLCLQGLLDVAIFVGLDQNSNIPRLMEYCPQGVDEDTWYGCLEVILLEFIPEPFR